MWLLDRFILVDGDRYPHGNDHISHQNATLKMILIDFPCLMVGYVSSLEGIPSSFGLTFVVFSFLKNLDDDGKSCAVPVSSGGLPCQKQTTPTTRTQKRWRSLED